MAGYFFDSSALVKHYHPESGTPAVDQIINAEGNMVRVSRLTVAELTSAFAIKVRTQSINREDAEFSRAELLVERYAFSSRLRALDALQLAVALELRDQKLVDYLVGADAILCEVAGIEGLSVINPEHS